MTKKFFDNNSGSASTIMITVLTSLIISSSMIAWFLLQIYGVTISGIPLPLSGSVYTNNQDYTSTTTFNASILEYSNPDAWEYQDSVGIVLQGDKIFKEFIYLKYLIPDSNNDYKNKYVINNSVHSSYIIILKGYPGDAFPSGLSGDLYLDIKDDVVRVRTGGFFGGTDLDIQAISGVTSDDTVTIETTYNVADKSMKYTINDITKTVTNIDFGFDWDPLNRAIYGGIGADTDGFTLQSFNAVSGFVVSENVVDTAVSFGYTVLKIVFWTLPQEYFPFELNVILIKTQLVGLAVAVFFFFRGSD